MNANERLCAHGQKLGAIAGNGHVEVTIKGFSVEMDESHQAEEVSNILVITK